jgi:hypothetical protein
MELGKEKCAVFHLRNCHSFRKKIKKLNNVICSDVLIFYRILYQIHG